MEALNIANIQSLEILSVTQPRQPFSSEQLDKFDFKTAGINLRNNLETVTFHIREEDLAVNDIWTDFRHSQLLANTPKLKTLVMCFSQEPAQLQDNDGAFDRYLSGSFID